MEAPEAQREAEGSPIPLVEPSTRFAARVASGIFAGEALILFVMALLPQASTHEVGRFAIPAACAIAALVLRLYTDRVGERTLQLAAVAGTALVSLHVAQSGDGPSESGEMLYCWLALYAAYFFSGREAAAQIGLMSGAYLGVLLVSVPPHNVIGSWLTFVGVLVPSAAVLRSVRDAVQQLVRSLSQAARTDPLTRLKNRLALDQEIEVELERARRTESQLSIVIADLDHFKLVNDELGHRAGDDLLRVVANGLRHRMRTYDLVVRLGGDEFLCALPDISLDEAHARLEDLRAELQVSRDSSISVGFAALRQGESPQDLVDRADHDLLATRGNGAR
jgi:two-component system, cell cycle response regulator